MRNPDILKETVVAFDEGLKLLPRPTPYHTLRRWALKGLFPKTGRAPGQKRITLEFCHHGGRPVTSLEAWWRFQRKINGEKP